MDVITTDPYIPAEMIERKISRNIQPMTYSLPQISFPFIDLSPKRQPISSMSGRSG